MHYCVSNAEGKFFSVLGTGMYLFISQCIEHSAIPLGIRFACSVKIIIDQCVQGPFVLMCDGMKAHFPMMIHEAVGVNNTQVNHIIAGLIETI